MNLFQSIEATKPFLESVKPVLENLSFVAVMFSAPLAAGTLFFQLRDSKENARKAQRDAAERVYREVDDKFFQFIEIAIRHPRLNCYSIADAAPPSPPLNADEVTQQKLLYCLLIDVMEVAYVCYHNDAAGQARSFYERQWNGWIAYVERMMLRNAFQVVWTDVRDEYDKSFCIFMNRMLEKTTVGTKSS
ncbi:MAG: hypothetical protein HY286_07325 [Planctomycetes bacterium]|nr:hypothetical protein [Planctomycetota bacterium]